MTHVLGDASVSELDGAIAGRVIRPTDPEYDEARKVWNAVHDKHPALVVRPTSTEDVVHSGPRRRTQHRGLLDL